MGYYRRPMGDYTTGGYGAAGDPGLLSFIGKAAGAIWKVAKPVIGGILGGPVGAVVGGAVAGAAAGKAVVPYAGAPPPPPGGIPAAAGAFTGAAVGAYRGAAAGYAGGVCPSGYHPAKDGSGRCVRNRRMNIANPRALRRSLRRVKGFEKLARKTIVMTRRVRAK